MYIYIKIKLDQPNLIVQGQLKAKQKKAYLHIEIQHHKVRFQCREELNKGIHYADLSVTVNVKYKSMLIS
jgi:hypothetical protein